ncbi:Methylcrotonyl-CoA carboxylase biotin-containing subunit [hydrothermal vent metagenome]|uniref:Methylcrotonyl-CoA carboxylase biotin-containing subunit n=1 Tax=hydrothermal vent metagenome TaxID=652676 RepID=A0A3B0S017_9ZZZZ
MFTSVLIANRGEIACRILETARTMGVRSIAVYSDADAGARHVRLADEAVCIGPSEAAKSYLDMERILAAAKQTGAEAIHPGYGFLSENPEFAEKCVDAGIIFIGPSAKSMRQMALKDQAKILMQAAGVPVTPGYHEENQDDQVLADAAAQIGFPVLIKAVAGGGGRGMRKVQTAKDFAEQLVSARREAAAFFGNDKVLIEKFIQNPRHIEVQVFGDQHGNVVHFYERDCSVQRRHQKVIEEAPAPGMSKPVRAAMCDAAIKAAKTVNYAGAGTVEFIVDGSGPLAVDAFWFMEMNTRLQVEHPVTEAITNTDLVKLQFEVAAGAVLPAQDSIKLSGHAIEARLYAEQPDKGFMPSTGKLHWFVGAKAADVRFDTGFAAGDRVSEFYDPMLAKIIVHRASRKSAIADLADTLQNFQSWPVRINARFLTQILRHTDFAQGRHDTGFIDKYLDEFLQSTPSPEQLAAHVGQAILRSNSTSNDPWAQTNGWRMNGQPVWVDRLQIAGEVMQIRIVQEASKQLVLVNGQPVAGLDGAWQQDLQQMPTGQRVLFLDGSAYEINTPDADADGTEQAALDTVLAPMPGKVLDVRTIQGASVTAGEVLLVMEAMKMEQALKAPRDGVVDKVLVSVGGQVSEGDVLVSLQGGDESS